MNFGIVVMVASAVILTVPAAARSFSQAIITPQIGQTGVMTYGGRIGLNYVIN